MTKKDIEERIKELYGLYHECTSLRSQAYFKKLIVINEFIYKLFFKEK
jgi:hypothetical protein